VVGTIAGFHGLETLIALDIAIAVIVTTTSALLAYVLSRMYEIR